MSQPEVQERRGKHVAPLVGGESDGDSRRVFFLYNYPHQPVYRAFLAGEIPCHRLYGFVGLQELGFHCSLCAQPRWLKGRKLPHLAWRIYQAIVVLRRQASLRCVIATTEPSALPCLLLRRVGLLRRPVLLMSVALLHPKNLRGIRFWLWRAALPSAQAVIVYSSEQREQTASVFGVPDGLVHFMPLGVDPDFDVDSTASPGRADFVLSAGTNEARDFRTLIRAMPSGVPLRIVTDEINQRIVEQTRHRDEPIRNEGRVTRRELGRLYRSTAVSVLPLADAAYSSGQTVLLESMAAGTPVIVSDVGGVRDYVDAGTTAVVVPPDAVASLRVAIVRALRDPAARQTMGRRAREAVLTHFSARTFASRLASVVRRV